MIKFKIIALFSLGLLVITSCKKIVDINNDPNNSSQPVLSLLLPSTEISMAGNMTQVNNGASAIMQQLANTSIERYQQNGSDFESSWSGFYTQTLSDIQTIISEGTRLQQWGYVSIGKLQKAYLFSIMVDLWGDVPYTETVQGEKIKSPAFEKGNVVYDSVFALIDAALADMNNGFIITPASADVIYNGSLDKWKRMANSLKLKLFNQIRLVDPVRAGKGIKDLISSGAPLINDNASNYTFKFGTSLNPNNRHPWHRSEYQASKSFYMNQALIDRLFNSDDPRLRYYIYRQNPTVTINNGNNGNGYYGRYPADATGAPADNSRRSTLGIYPAGGLHDNSPIKNLPASNVYLTNAGATGTPKSVAVTDGTGAGLMPYITYAMVMLIRAEAALTLSTGEDARQNFLDAVTASLSSVSSFAATDGGLPLSNISGFVNRLGQQYDSTDDKGKLNLIMTQKYIASFGNGIEAYNDYRRTALPVLSPPMAPLNTFPMRFYYAASELATNTTVSGGAAQLQAAQQTTPVFWSK